LPYFIGAGQALRER